jgi:pimeloyl-ACP methyl ester carboxylesterase
MQAHVTKGDMPGISVRAGLLSWLAALLCLALAGPAAARVEDRVELQLGNGLVATAQYRHGSRGTAVLLLHGFLQTSNYLTVTGLMSGLADQGYTVLTPTLSLGVDRRRASLDCAAIHTHNLSGDLVEIRDWVAWLEKRGYQRIVLLGHSQGSLELMAYAADTPSPSIKLLIATSLVGTDYVLGEQVFQEQIWRAQRELKAGQQKLDAYRLSYCPRYMAPPEAFLSYANWPRSRILETLARLKLPAVTILGGADPRMHPDWPAQLRAQGVAVEVISGAGHFFDAQYEFDLLDEVVSAIESPPGEQP